MKATDNDIRMRLVSINEINFMMNYASSATDDIAKDLNIGFSVGFKPEDESDQIDMEFGVQYTLDNGTTILECRYNFRFEVQNLHEFINTEKDTVTIHGLMPHFLNIAIGSMRGILVVKTSGSPLSKYPIPITDAAVLSKMLHKNADKIK